MWSYRIQSLTFSNQAGLEAGFVCVVKYIKDRYLGVVVYVGTAKFLSDKTSLMFGCFIFITAVIGRITEPHKAILLSLSIHIFLCIC